MAKKTAMFSLLCQLDLERHFHNSWCLQLRKVYELLLKICIVIPTLTVILDQLSRDCEIYGISFVDL